LATWNNSFHLTLFFLSEQISISELCCVHPEPILSLSSRKEAMGYLHLHSLALVLVLPAGGKGYKHSALLMLPVVLLFLAAACMGPVAYAAEAARASDMLKSNKQLVLEGAAKVRWLSDTCTKGFGNRHMQQLVYCVMPAKVQVSSIKLRTPK
jgi:hypothetical protein